jgi:hypothetical protein
MSVEVEVQNFQSIEKQSICVQGFTALVGKSNIGKSAFVRALKSALTNPLGTDFVRHGASCVRRTKGAKSCKCFAQVHVKMPGFDLLWKKGDAVNCYVFNGQTYDKPERGIPEFLSRSGFSPVRIGDEAGMIQVADQFFPIFLLNKPATAVAESISDVSRLNVINEAMKRAEKDRREVASTRKVREKDLADLAEKAAVYDDLDRDVAKVETVAARLGELETLNGRVVAMTRFHERLLLVAQTIRRLMQVERIFVPSFEALSAAQAKFQAVQDLSVRFQQRYAAYQAIVWVEKLAVQVPEPEPMIEKRALLRRLDRWVDQLRGYRVAFEKLEAASAATPPDFAPLLAATKKAKDLARLAPRVAQLEKIVTRIEAEIATVEAEEKAILAELDALGACPTCARPYAEKHAHE